MTLREIFVALARGAWIIVAVTAIAGVAGYVYLTRVPYDYTATATMRANTFLTDAIQNGAIAGLPADLDPSVMLTPTVLDPAAQSLGITSEALAASISYVPLSDGRALTVTVSAKTTTAPTALARANAVVDGYVKLVNDSVANTLATLQGAVAATTGQVQNYQSQLAANPTDPVASANLAAALSTLSAQNAQVAVVQSAGSLIVVQARATDAISSQPQAKIVLPLAIVCGLLAGAGLVLIIDRLDDRLRQTDDVETLVGTAVIAELPYDRAAARRRKKIRLPAGAGRQGVLAESLRSLRTSTQVMLPDGRGVVVLTSVEPGDGKTFVSANLAVSWSRAGRRVILVSGDMRRPELHQYFPDVAGRRGLSDLLALQSPGKRLPTQAQIEETLVATGYRGLRVLPPGSETDDAADLLGGPNLPRVLGFAARIADVVVVDAPPTLALADASELAASADGVILIASVRRTRRRLLLAAIEALRTNDLTVLGVVVNRSKKRLPRTYAAYYTGKSADARPVRPATVPGARRGVGPDEARRSDRVPDLDHGRASGGRSEIDDLFGSDPDHALATLTGRDRRTAALAADDDDR